MPKKNLSAPFYAIKIRSEGLTDSFFGNFLARFKLKTLWQFEGQDRLDSVPIPFFNCDINEYHSFLNAAYCLNMLDISGFKPVRKPVINCRKLWFWNKLIGNHILLCRRVKESFRRITFLFEQTCIQHIIVSKIQPHAV